MELFSNTHAGEKMLGHLHSVLLADFPDLNPAQLGLECRLSHIKWWKSGSATPFEDFVTLFHHLTTHIDDSLGYRLARKAQLTDLGMMGYAMMTAANVEQFIQVAAYALQQFEYPVDIELLPAGADTIKLVFSEHQGKRPYFFKFLELSVAMSWHYVASIQPPDLELSPREVHFQCAATENGQRVAEAFFKAPVKYAQASNAIVMPAMLTQAKLPAGKLDDIIACSVQCRHILSGQRRGGAAQKRVERALIESPDNCKFLFADTARYLGVSATALRAQLDRENASFRDIVKNLRMELATEYLSATQLPVQHIAYTLGYREPNNFIRAFKTHFNCPPGEYRSRQAVL